MLDNMLLVKEASTAHVVAPEHTLLLQALSIALIANRDDTWLPLVLRIVRRVPKVNFLCSHSVHACLVKAGMQQKKEVWQNVDRVYLDRMPMELAMIFVPLVNQEKLLIIIILKNVIRVLKGKLSQSVDRHQNIAQIVE
jgi:hypothetical protein